MSCASAGQPQTDRREKLWEFSRDASNISSSRLAHLLSFRHAIVISLPLGLKKDPGTFQLSLMWQMSDNSAFNLSPPGAKCARQQTDAAVIRGMVDSWQSWNWILIHQNVLITMSGWSRAEAPFSLLKPCLFWKANKAWKKKKKKLLDALDRQIQQGDAFHSTWALHLFSSGGCCCWICSCACKRQRNNLEGSKWVISKQH